MISMCTFALQHCLKARMLLCNRSCQNQEINIDTILLYKLRSYLDLDVCSNNVLHRSGQIQGHALHFSCLVSLVSFNLEQILRLAVYWRHF